MKDFPVKDHGSQLAVTYRCKKSTDEKNLDAFGSLKASENIHELIDPYVQRYIHKHNKKMRAIRIRPGIFPQKDHQSKRASQWFMNQKVLFQGHTEGLGCSLLYGLRGVSSCLWDHGMLQTGAGGVSLS